ncbi:MAG: hypothetical protein A3I66_11565 [Burkholderiales bacterium RIFCSPLOWO2_02_FULL_57_36]|nr:MAG: hypothetical protein A3I66_11565 [Burkholderiales bacterium RIFCSPLOWO2_02_FULL_57_36]
MPLVFQRTYNSAASFNGIFGANWSVPYSQSLKLHSTYALADRADGKILYFALSNGLFQASGDIADKLVSIKNADGHITSYKLISSKNDTVELYNVAGRLYAIVDRNGQSISLTYSNSSTPVSVAPRAGLLIKVGNSFGNALHFSYDSNSRVREMTDGGQTVYQYDYDVRNNLASVRYPDLKKRTYIYNEPTRTQGASLLTALTGIVDENGVRYATYQYEPGGKATSTEHAGGADKATLTYFGSGTYVSTRVLDPLDTTRTYYFQSILGMLKPTGQSQAAGAGCGPAYSGIIYDANGNIASRTDFNGNKACYAYDLARNLETTRVEGLPSSADCAAALASSSLVAPVRKVTTDWHSTYRLPVRVAEPLRVTINGYDPNGNLLSKTVQATADATGSQAFSATATGTARIWRTTYNDFGQVLTATGPRTDVNDLSTYAYDTATGNLVSVTNAAGHVTTLSNYDGNGRVGKIIDANGLTTDLQYTPRGWLQSRTVTGNGVTELTSYDYDGVGQLKKVTLPDSSWIGYDYDAAHRLTDTYDSTGNRISYTLDAMGNRVKEEVKDPTGALAKQTTRLYDALNRLKEVTGAGQ